MKRMILYFTVILSVFLCSCASHNTDVPDNVVAEYRGEQITKEIIAQNIETIAFLSGDGEQRSEKEMLDEILENMILLYEAEHRGLGATEEEIQGSLDNIAQAYEIPEGKEFLDAYFLEYDLTYEEYIELQKDYLPRVIARQKLRDTIGREYCEDHGLEFSKINPPKEMTDAVDAYIEKLVKSERKHVIYYQ